LLESVVEADSPATVLRAELLRLGGESQRWPDDDAFKAAWLNRPVYTELRPAKVCAVLRALERAGRTGKQETVSVPLQSVLTVEHVMPQSWATASVLKWYPLAIDNELHRRDRARRVQTFGNLTLLTQALNSAVSNGPFQDRDVPQAESTPMTVVPGKKTGFQGSLLVMNGYFQNLQVWGDAEIDLRGEVLFEQAKLAWPRPCLAP
jgi:Protein of unknown function (DUF1524)